MSPIAPRKFLVIDHHRDSRELLVRSLRRKFSHAEVVESAEVTDACRQVGGGTFEAVVLHRTLEVDAVTLVTMLRQIDAAVPIIVLSGIDRREAVVAAGADDFLNYEQWLMLGMVVAERLARSDVPDAGPVA